MKRGRITAFITICAVIMIILAYRDLASANMNVYMLIALISAPMLFLSKDYLMPYIMFVTPFISGLIPYYLGVAVIVSVIKFQIRSLSQIIPALILIGLEVFHYISFPTTHTVPELLSYFSVLFLFFYIISLQDGDIDYKMCLKCYIYSMMCVITIMFVRNYIYYNDFTMALSDRHAFLKDVDNEYQFFSDNANNIALFCVTVFSCLLLGRRRLEMSNWSYYVCLALAIIFGAFTISRTWILTILFALFLYLLSRKQRGVAIFVALLLIGVLALLPVLEGTLIYSLFQDRLSDDTMSTGGGRTEIFEFFHHGMFSDFFKTLFGVGAFEIKDVFMHDSPHNGIQQIFVSYGFIGIIVFLVFALNFCKINTTKRYPLIYHIPFIVVFLFLQTDQFLLPCQIMMTVVVSSFCLKLPIETEENNQIIGL